MRTAPLTRAVRAPRPGWPPRSHYRYRCPRALIAVPQTPTSLASLRGTTSLFFLCNSVGICALLSTVAPARKGVSAEIVPVPASPSESSNDLGGDPSEEPSMLPSQSEPLALFRDALFYGESKTKIWESYQALRSFDRRFFIRDDYTDLLNAICGLDETAAVDACLVVLEDMTTSKIYPSVDEYRIAFRLCRRASRVDSAEELFARLRASKVTLEKSFFEDLIVLYGAAGELMKASNAYRDMVDAGFSRSDVVYGALMDAATRTGNLRQAEILYAEMLSVGLKPNSETFAALIYGNVWNQRLPKAMSLLREMMDRNLQPSVRTYTHLINGFSRASQPEVVTRLARLMEFSGEEPDVVYYGSLIAHAARHGTFEEVDDVLRAMESRKIEPTEAIHDSILAGVLMHGDVNAVLVAVNRMIKTFGVPGERTLNTLLLAFAKGQDLLGATTLLNGWKADGGAVTSVHCTTYVNLLAEVNGIPAALDYLKESLIDPAAGDAGMFNVLLTRTMRSHAEDMTSKVMIAMRNSGVEPDAVTYNILLSNLTDAEALQQVQKTALLENKLNHVGCLILLKNAARRKDAVAATKVHKLMQDLDIPLNKIAWTTLAHAYGRAGDVHKMEEVHEQMQKSGWDMDVVSYTTLIKAYVDIGAMDAAEQAWARMLSADCRPNLRSYTCMLGGYIRSKNYPAAWNLITSMKAAQIQPDLALRTALLHFGSLEDVEASVRQQMSEASAPDAMFYNTVFNVYKGHAAIDLVAPLLGDMLGRGVPPDHYTFAAVFQTYARAPRHRIHSLVARVFEQLRDHNVLTDGKVVFTELARAHAKVNNVEGIVAAWDRAVVEMAPYPDDAAEVFAACLGAMGNCGPDVTIRFWREAVTPDLAGSQPVKTVAKDLGLPAPNSVTTLPPSPDTTRPTLPALRTSAP
ncbi:hypothetical protein HKX48_001181 [Thoreauomyces humboldtii]|nr:hypothetical protein HKX48_001181 [Thoreauomyces humboldtii]